MQFRHISQHPYNCPILKTNLCCCYSVLLKKQWEHNFLPGNLESICCRWILPVATGKHRQSWHIHYFCQRWKSDLYKTTVFLHTDRDEKHKFLPSSIKRSPCLRASCAPELARSEKRCREIPQDNQTSFPHPRNLPIH